jgi:hypothetical protein
MNSRVHVASGTSEGSLVSVALMEVVLFRFRST